MYVHDLNFKLCLCSFILICLPVLFKFISKMQIWKRAICYFVYWTYSCCGAALSYCLLRVMLSLYSPVVSYSDAYDSLVKYYHSLLLLHSCSFVNIFKIFIFFPFPAYSEVLRAYLFWKNLCLFWCWISGWVIRKMWLGLCSFVLDIWSVFVMYALDQIICMVSLLSCFVFSASTDC